MRGFWAGVMGLALVAPAGGALAQDAGAAPAQPPAAVQTGVTPAAPPAEDTQASGETATATGEATVAGWEGPIPEAPAGGRNRLTASAVDAWMAQPHALLDDNPAGGRAMSQFVRSLAGTDNRTVATLVGLALQPDVRDAQVGATAEGLASAMRDAEVGAPGYAAYIQWAVAQSGSRELIEAFERASGAEEDRTAAIGAGGGGGGGAGGGAGGSGSLSGGGAPGPSGPVGGSSTVAQSGYGSGSRGSTGSVAYSEGDSLLDGASGRIVVLCTQDASATGCQVVN
ncbi:hypothetical protein [Aureimonas flava]|uniref:hypothetical protein n=1 Tax=Aureimonas flava TaxID=2320271 RepID=UPI00145A00D4|nr:hypothetical protein [Aureimonas flava]